MIRTLWLSTFVSAVILVWQATSFAQKNRIEGEDSMGPSSFIVVHVEPRSAEEESFAKVAEMVRIANQNRAKLTIELVPQWADMILADPAKLEQVRSWKTQGHEIGAHHHGPLHAWDWDGYTDLTESEWSKWREEKHAGLRERAARLNDLTVVPYVEREERYRGTMKDYVEAMNRLVAPETIRCACMGPDANNDWPAEIPYSTEGIVIRPDGSYSIEESPANSRPQERVYNGHTVYEVSRVIA